MALSTADLIMDQEYILHCHNHNNGKIQFRIPKFASENPELLSGLIIRRRYCLSSNVTK